MAQEVKLNSDSDEFNFDAEFNPVIDDPAGDPDLEKFRRAMGYTAEVGPEFKGNDIELQVDLEKLIENNPVAQVALKDMMARTGGDLSKILRNLQPGNSDYASNTRGAFSGYTGRNKEAVLRNESTYSIEYNATDVFDATTKQGKGFVALLETLKVEGLPYPKILEVYKMLPDGSKVFNKEYYNSLSETQKTILQVKAENKENTLNTIVHELMHYGLQTLNDRGYISDALYKDIENLNTYGFVNFDTKEHVLIQEILTGDGKIPPQTDLQLLANADPKELYDFNKRKIARRLASEDLNTNPNIEVSYEDLVEKYLQLPNVEIDKLRLEGVDYFTAQKPAESSYDENPDYVSMEDENNPNVLEYNRATNQEYLDNLTLFGGLSYQDTDDYFADNLYRNDPKGGPFNQNFADASFNMQREAGKYLGERESLQDETGNISPIKKGNIGGLNKGLTPLKFATIQGANAWLADNDNPDVKQNLNTQTTKTFERPDNNPRAGYESGQDYLNENRGLPSYLSDGPMEGPESFRPETETYTGPVPELMAEGGFVTGMNWWKDNDLEEMEIEDLTGEEELKFAEGGPVMELDEQTEMAFGNGSARVDPVSGNEVPPGALPEEVRDDIPARLSEGEYVVPADVLQYYGIKFFEDLRGKAKMELSGMEQNGRMGGEPVNDAPMESMEKLPFGAEELQSYEDGQEAPAQGFAEGGPVTEAASMFPTTMIKTYINEAGSKLYIRFVNGIAIPPVPPGYVEEGSTIDAVVAPTTPTNLEPEDNSDYKGGEPRVFLKDFGAMSSQELARFAGETADTTLNKVLGGRLGRGQNKAWEAFVEKIQKNGTASQIEYINNLNTMKKAGDRDGLMALSGGLSHSDIMATGSEKTNSKNAGTGKDGTKFTFVVPGDDTISSISKKPLGKQLTNIEGPTEAQKTTTKEEQEAAVKAEDARRDTASKNFIKSKTDDAGSEGANVGGGTTKETGGKDLGFREDAAYGLMNKGGLATRKKKKK